MRSDSRRLRGVLCILAGLMAGGQADADARLYDCQITERRPEADWVSQRMALVVAEDGSVTVIDEVLIHFEQSPKSARVRVRGDILHVTWNVSNVVDRAQQLVPKMSYSAKLDTGTREIQVRASPVGFPQSFRGTGRCEERRD